MDEVLLVNVFAVLRDMYYAELLELRTLNYTCWINMGHSEPDDPAYSLMYFQTSEPTIRDDLLRGILADAQVDLEEFFRRLAELGNV